MGKTHTNDSASYDYSWLYQKGTESNWENLVDLLVGGRIHEIFFERNISIITTSIRLRKYYNNDTYEIDILAGNWKEIVVCDVRTILGIEDVQHFIDKLQIFKDIITGYKEYTVYGAIAFIEDNSVSEIFAQSNGLFTIKATGDSALITNEDDFKPKEW